jgi:hypothetical protein
MRAIDSWIHVSIAAGQQFTAAVTILEHVSCMELHTQKKNVVERLLTLRLVLRIIVIVVVVVYRMFVSIYLLIL